MDKESRLYVDPDVRPVPNELQARLCRIWFPGRHPKDAFPSIAAAIPWARERNTTITVLCKVKELPAIERYVPAHPLFDDGSFPREPFYLGLTSSKEDN